MSTPISINIRICNRNYKIKVAPENEQHVRDTLAQITKKIEEFHKNFPGRDEQDYMAMTLLDHITGEQARMQSGSNTNETDLHEKLQHLHKMLDT